MALDLHAGFDIHLIGDHVTPLHDVELKVDGLLYPLHQNAAVFGPDMAKPIQKYGKGVLLHPVAIFE